MLAVWVKKSPTKPNFGRKSEAYYKVMRIYETKIEMNTKCEKMYKKCFCRKKVLLLRQN